MPSFFYNIYPPESQEKMELTPRLRMCVVGMCVRLTRKIEFPVFVDFSDFGELTEIVIG